jgi:hypothetical protein
LVLDFLPSFISLAAAFFVRFSTASISIVPQNHVVKGLWSSILSRLSRLTTVQAEIEAWAGALEAYEAQDYEEALR